MKVGGAATRAPGHKAQYVPGTGRRPSGGEISGRCGAHEGGTVFHFDLHGAGFGRLVTPPLTAG